MDPLYHIDSFGEGFKGVRGVGGVATRTAIYEYICSLAPASLYSLRPVRFLTSPSRFADMATCSRHSGAPAAGRRLQVHLQDADVGGESTNLDSLTQPDELHKTVQQRVDDVPKWSVQMYPTGTLSTHKQGPR